MLALLALRRSVSSLLRSILIETSLFSVARSIRNYLFLACEEYHD
ncbi:hypothetical protein [Klebsiella pneumoniae IS22]|nr:hypothetical protein [Klebsiella pneumoniae IS22]